MKYYIDKCNSHKLLDKILEEEYNISKYELIFNKYGKPYLKNEKLFFNLSDANNISALVISDKEVGIDIEAFNYDEYVMEKYFNSKEKEMVINSQDKREEFTRIWTIKEAYLKYLGTGITSSLKDIDSNRIKSKSFIYDNYWISIVESD